MPLYNDAAFRGFMSEARDRDTRLILADWLEGQGHEGYAAQLRSGPVKDLDDYGWMQAFGFAGGDVDRDFSPCNHGTPGKAPPNNDVPTFPFGRVDVKRVIACQEGENDGPDWVCVGELWDGRFFALRAGCDYTGWD